MGLALIKERLESQRRSLSGLLQRVAEPLLAPSEVEVSGAISRALKHTKKSQPIDIDRQKRFAIVAIGAMQTATDGIDEIRSIIAELREVILEGKAAADRKIRKQMADHYERLRNEIDQVAMDASYEGVNLIDGGKNTLAINLDLNKRNHFTISHTNLTVSRKGLKLPSLKSAFEKDHQIDEILHLIELAEDHVKWALDVYREEALLLANKFAQDLKAAAKR